MRKTIFLMLGTAAMLASCSQDELDVAQGGGTAVITATVDDGIATRSTYDNDDVDITRCLLEVRDGEGKLVGKQHSMTEESDGTFTCTVRGLDPDTEYTYVFWADNGSAYTATDLTAVTMVDGKEAEALAFSNTIKGKPGDVSAELKHAVAKVTLKTTGSLINGDKVKAEISGAASTVNALTGEASGTAQYEGETTMTADINAGEVMTFYVPASAEGQVADMKITFTAVDGNASLSKDVTNIPLQANYRTLISGDIGNIGTSELTATLSDKPWNDNEGAQFITSVIKLDEAGTLTEEMIDKAIEKNAGRIVITGKVNQQDMTTLFNHLKSTDGTVRLDMSGATLEDENTSLSSSVQGLSNIESFAMPEGITDIPDKGFMGCTGLKTVTFPSTLETIGDYAFTKLSLSGELVIPASVTKVGTRAFAGTWITSLVWNSDFLMMAEIFSSCPYFTTVTINSDLSGHFRVAAFRECYALDEINLTYDYDKVPEIVFVDATEIIESVSRINVQADLVEAFKTAEGWSQYADKIFAIE